MNDYYEILGVEKTASKADIKKAFRKLAHQYHPDKKGGNEEQFKKINEAYQVLSDDAKRAQYDTYGQTFSQGAGPGAGGFDFSGFGGGGFDFSDLFRQAQAGGGMGADFGDIFGSVFGGGRSARRGRDIAVDVEVSFSESIFGAERKMLINKIGTCETCDGKGAKPGTKKKKCATCAGKGSIRESQRSFLGTFTTQRQCDTCYGSGEVPEEQCPACRGAGVLKRADEISIKVPAGIQDGEMIRMSGRGEAIPHGAAGDLYVKVHVEKHPLFRRDANNLVMDLSVKLSEALLGSEHGIKTLDGDLKLKIPAGISHGEVLRVRGKGVPVTNSERGDLLVRILVKMPGKLSRKAEKLIEELKNEGI